MSQSKKFRTIQAYFRGQSKDEEIEKLLEQEAKHGFELVGFAAETTPFSYRFIFSKVESEKKHEK
jgi:hypothetical protein